MAEDIPDDIAPLALRQKRLGHDLRGLLSDASEGMKNSWNFSWNQYLRAFWKSTKLFTYDSKISWFHGIFESE